MKTAFITHQACINHQVPEWHVELPERLKAIHRHMKNVQDVLYVDDYPDAQNEDFLLAHDAEFVASALESPPNNKIVEFFPEVYKGAGTPLAIRKATGAVLHALDLVMDKKVQNAFCAIRPPGHHASQQRAHGFCFVNNIVIGAMAGLERYKMNRVAIIDFDVHHGNGTQDIVWNNPNIQFASTHRSGIFPGTGYAGETGAHNNVINLPYGYDCSSEQFIKFYSDIIIPRVQDFNPDIIFVSAGYDAHRDDPLGVAQLTTGDFARVMEMICDAANQCCEGNLIAVLEGGYNAEVLGRCVAECVSVMKQ